MRQPSKKKPQTSNFKRILKKGYPTRESAVGDSKMAQALANFIGPYFHTEYTVVDESELKARYESISK